MATLLLSQKLAEQNKEFSDIFNTVDINNTEKTVKLHTLAVANAYKQVSNFVSTTEVNKKDVRKVKSMKALMQQSVFHGAGWLGKNFIA